jgi:hypothetical protein
MQIRAKKAQLAELRHEVLGESSFAVMLLDDGNDFALDKLARGLPHQFFFVIQLRIQIDEVHSAESSHTPLLARMNVTRPQLGFALKPRLIAAQGF